MTAKSVFTLFFFLLISGIISAQSPKVKFGKVEEADLLMTVCPADSTASAYILHDEGGCNFEYTNHEGFILVFNRFTRIKILTKDGYDFANVSVPFYVSKSGEKEQVYGINGCTHKLVNGKVETTKLDKKYVFEEQAVDGYNQTKFTFPNVTEGVIIEYKYTIRSPFAYNLPSWRFQSSAPTKYSCYTVSIPEYYRYNKNQKGYEHIVLKEDQNRQTINVGTGRDMFTASFTNTLYEFTGTNLPAIKNEPFMTTIKDYASQIEFELMNISFPGSLIKNYSSTWAQVDEKLMESDGFGRQLGKSVFRNEIKELLASDTTGGVEVKAVKILDFVRSRVKWNSTSSSYSNGIKDAYAKGTGNSADVNLLLVEAFRNGGLNAHPVILSTRSNGMLPLSSPSITKFNYVIACVDDNGKKLYFDATDPNSYTNVLPERCLVNKARAFNGKTGDWVNLKELEVPNVSVKRGTLSFNDDGILTGSFLETATNQLASQKKEDYKQYDNVDKYTEKIEHDNGIKLTNFKAEGYDKTGNTVSEKINFINEQINTQSDIIYLTPLVFREVGTNPFKSEVRTFPIDFPYPRKTNYTISFVIPEGYKADEVPKSEKFTFEDNDIVVTYITQQKENILQLLYKVELNNTLIIPSQYAMLKEFFSKIVAKEKEMVVLKREKK